MKLLTMIGLGQPLGSFATAQQSAQQAAPCDRACLSGFVDQYLDAVLKHDPKLVPLTKNVKYTENGQRLDPGDGLWRSMVGRRAVTGSTSMMSRPAKWYSWELSAKRAERPPSRLPT